MWPVAHVDCHEYRFESGWWDERWGWGEGGEVGQGEGMVGLGEEGPRDVLEEDEAERRE